MFKIGFLAYLNYVQSSWRLEGEAQCGVELMCLTGQLAPNFKTIVNLRQANGTASRSVCSQFVSCR